MPSRKGMLGWERVWGFLEGKRKIKEINRDARGRWREAEVKSQSKAIELSRQQEVRR